MLHFVFRYCDARYNDRQLFVRHGDAIAGFMAFYMYKVVNPITEVPLLYEDCAATGLQYTHECPMLASRSYPASVKAKEEKGRRTSTIFRLPSARQFSDWVRRSTEPFVEANDPLEQLCGISRGQKLLEGRVWLSMAGREQLDHSGCGARTVGG